MPIELHEEMPGRLVMRISGALTTPDFQSFQADAARLMSARGTLDVLCLADGFEGWTGPGWDDPALTEYAVKHEADVRRIAIVADARWKDELVAFAGGYYTSRDVEFFPPDQFDEARAWLQRTG